jgi:hypothetical protein
MNINEIIFKNQLDQSEMEFVVEEYILEKKNVKVKINITNHPGLQHMPQEFQAMIIQNQLQLLNMAYETALTYFISKYKSENPPIEYEDNVFIKK